MVVCVAVADVVALIEASAMRMMQLLALPVVLYGAQLCQGFMEVFAPPGPLMICCVCFWL